MTWRNGTEMQSYLSRHTLGRHRVWVVLNVWRAAGGSQGPAHLRHCGHT